MNGSTSKKHELEEENHRLQQKVDQLREELQQRDNLIISLEAQITSLIKEGKLLNGSEDVTPSRAGFPPKPPTTNRIHRPNGRGAVDDRDESASPPKPRNIKRWPVLDPPSRSEVEMSSPLPAPKQSVHERIALHGLKTGSNGESNPLALPFVDNDNEMKVVEEPQRGENNPSEDGVVSDHTDIPRRRVLRTALGAIKALPRELSIFNSDNDDVTKYSIDDDLPTHHLESVEMRDAYNARGIYTGSVSRKEQMPHGQGVMHYHHQSRSYEGDWVLGHWHGVGRIQNPKGDIYEGPFVNDLKEGQGKLVYADGRVFEGSFQQDDPVHGTLTFPDGARYVGDLHNGSRHGYGIYYFKDNSTYEGYSVMNKFEGEGKMTWTDGGWYQGEWMQGEIHGYGMEIRADGSLRHKGQWSKGVPIRL